MSRRAEDGRGLPWITGHHTSAMEGVTDLDCACHVRFSAICTCGAAFVSSPLDETQAQAMKTVSRLRREHIEAVKLGGGKDMDDLERVEASIAALEAERLRLLSLPPEPTFTDDAQVIWFKRQYTNGRVYTYAAVKTDDGLWYSTGPSAPKGYTWDQFRKWLFDGSLVSEVWLASEWQTL